MIVHNVEQGSYDWLALRRGIPTATDFKEIVTAVKGDLSASSSKLIDKLIDQRVRPDMQEVFQGNRHTDRGLELEPQARDWYEFMTGACVKQVGFVTRDDGRAGCSPDGLVYDVVGTYAMGDEQGRVIPVHARAGLEIKCPDGPTHVGYLRAKSLPDEYKQQVHGGMVITGLRAWDFVSYCPGYPPLMLRIEWNEYTDKLAKALDEFLARLDIAIREVCHVGA